MTGVLRTYFLEGGVLVRPVATVLPPTPQPGVTGFSPPSGVVGATIQILGHDLTGAIRVRFLGGGANTFVDATTFTVLDSGHLNVVIPTGAADGAIQVTTPGGQAQSPAVFDVTTPINPPPPPPAGFTLVKDEQFAASTPPSWISLYGGTTGNNFGSPTRIQTYFAANAAFGSAKASAGATNGTSCKMTTIRLAAGNYTAAMWDTKSANYFFPRYGRFECRMKIPHGQGLWPAWWLTAKTGGASTVEVDLMEYFHSQVPGKTTTTLHRADNSGTLVTNLSKKSYVFEPVTVTPGWHTFAVEIKPASDANIHTPGASTTFAGYLDGVLVWSYTDVQSTWWTTNGGSEDSFYNMYWQGCQVDGNYVGSPEGPKGYSHELDQCISGGGTKPNACTTVVGGQPIVLPTWTETAASIEIDYVRAYKYTG